jgi:hypothetical protein
LSLDASRAERYTWSDSNDGDARELRHRRQLFPAAAYYHIGDTDVDDHYATGAGFMFLKADGLSRRRWPAALFVDPGGGSEA